MTRDYRISYRYSTHGSAHYRGLWCTPGDPHWRTVKNSLGEPTECETPREAEALAGHCLVNFLNKLNEANRTGR